MAPRGLLARPKGNAYECAPPLRRDIFAAILPVSLFDGPTRCLTTLNGMCAQATGSRWLSGGNYAQVEAVSSRKRKDLMTKLESGEMDAANYALRRIGRVNRVLAVRHMLEQGELDAGAMDLRSKICSIMSSTTNVHTRMEAMHEAVKETIPAIAWIACALAHYLLGSETQHQVGMLKSFWIF